MTFPEPFATNIKTVFPTGADWLENLPALQRELAGEWSLTVSEPTWPLSFNWVAPAVCADGTPAVLKLGVPNPERTAEIETLRLWDGRGCARLLRADPERGAMLIEKIAPGAMLSTLEDDDEATKVAAGVFAAVHLSPQPPDSVPQPPGLGESMQNFPQTWGAGGIAGGERVIFPTVADWARELDELRPRFGGGTGPFPARLVDAAEGLYRELLPSQGPPVLLHGDLHHFNILCAGEERGWLAIDPQGVIGEAEYEVGALLRNHDLDRRDFADLKRLTARRVDLLAETLGFDRQRLVGWGLGQAVLSAWWDWHEGVPETWTSSMFPLADALNDLR